jgi:hypothetical protein
LGSEERERIAGRARQVISSSTMVAGSEPNPLTGSIGTKAAIAVEPWLNMAHLQDEPVISAADVLNLWGDDE